MRTASSVMLGAWLAVVTPAFAEDLPDGTFASIPEGCAALKEKTPTELGDELDFYVLTKAGISADKQRCDFVQVTPQGEGRWLAEAFCDEDDYIYPDLFAIARTDKGGLAVTRLTDVTHQSGSETEGPAPFGEDDMNPVELDRDPAEGEDEFEPDVTEEPLPKPDGYDYFVLCPDVKP
ncbi:MAG: hypothetical protein R3D30_11055 [Hyphomicrobiales bacterium]